MMSTTAVGHVNTQKQGRGGTRLRSSSKRARWASATGRKGGHALERASGEEAQGCGGVGKVSGGYSGHASSTSIASGSLSAIERSVRASLVRPSCAARAAK